MLKCGAAKQHSGVNDREDQKRAPSQRLLGVNFHVVLRQLLANIKLPPACALTTPTFAAEAC